MDKLASIFDLKDLDSGQLLYKIVETMTNYEEDKRSLRTLIEEKEKFAQLSEQYYQEKESVIVERNQLMNKLEGSIQAKLERRVKQIEEERNIMKSDYNI
jgi:hypothetical protein